MNWQRLLVSCIPLGLANFCYAEEASTQTEPGKVSSETEQESEMAPAQYSVKIKSAFLRLEQGIYHGSRRRFYETPKKNRTTSESDFMEEPLKVQSRFSINGHADKVGGFNLGLFSSNNSDASDFGFVQSTVANVYFEFGAITLTAGVMKLPTFREYAYGSSFQNGAIRDFLIGGRPTLPAMGRGVLISGKASDLQYDILLGESRSSAQVVSSWFDGTSAFDEGMFSSVLAGMFSAGSAGAGTTTPSATSLDPKLLLGGNVEFDNKKMTIQSALYFQNYKEKRDTEGDVVTKHSFLNYGLNGGFYIMPHTIVGASYEEGRFGSKDESISNDGQYTKTVYYRRQLSLGGEFSFKDVGVQDLLISGDTIVLAGNFGIETKGIRPTTNIDDLAVSDDAKPSLMYGTIGAETWYSFASKTDNQEEVGFKHELGLELGTTFLLWDRKDRYGKSVGTTGFPARNTTAALVMKSHF